VLFILGNDETALGFVFWRVLRSSAVAVVVF